MEFINVLYHLSELQKILLHHDFVELVSYTAY